MLLAATYDTLVLVAMFVGIVLVGWAVVRGFKEQRKERQARRCRARTA
jgi:hypothetical protein